MTKAIGFKPNPTEADFIKKYLAENHWSSSKLFHKMLKLYMALFFEDCIDKDGLLIEAKQKVIEELKAAEQIKTAETLKREAAKQETEKLKLENKKKHITRYSGPRIDWGKSEGGFELNQEDGFYDAE